MERDAAFWAELAKRIFYKYSRFRNENPCLDEERFQGEVEALSKRWKAKTQRDTKQAAEKLAKSLQSFIRSL